MLAKLYQEPLYEIANNYQQILDNLYDENGEISDEQLAKLNASELAINEKALAVASYIQNLAARRDEIKELAKTMAERAKRLDKAMEDLKGYLLYNMKRCGLTKINSPYFDVTLKNCPPSVSITDSDAIPENYQRVKTIIEPDKIKLAADLKSGLAIPGAQLVQNQTVVIK